MKSSTKDNSEGKIHQVKGRIKQAVGILFGNSELEEKGKDEKTDGKIQEKVGQIKKVIDK